MTARAKPKERARARMVRAKAKARKARRARTRNRWSILSSSKDTAGTARSGDTSVPLQKAHRRRQSKGGAAAASVDNDGEVAAVMEVDDAVMEVDGEG